LPVYRFAVARNFVPVDPVGIGFDQTFGSRITSSQRCCASRQANSSDQDFFRGRSMVRAADTSLPARSNASAAAPLAEITLALIDQNGRHPDHGRKPKWDRAAGLARRACSLRCALAAGRLVAQRTRAQDQIERIGVGRPLSGTPCAFDIDLLTLSANRDAPDDIVLTFGQAPTGMSKRSAPYLRAALARGKLGINAQDLANLAHAAFEQIAHASSLPACRASNLAFPLIKRKQTGAR